MISFPARFREFPRDRPLLALAIAILAVELVGASGSIFDETMADQLERHHVPGAAVLVVKDDEIFLAKGYGVAFVLTWIYNATGSVLLAIIAHTGFNTANSTLVPLPLEVIAAGDSTTILVVTTVVLWVVVAVLLVATRGRLGYDGASAGTTRTERGRPETQ